MADPPPMVIPQESIFTFQVETSNHVDINMDDTTPANVDPNNNPHANIVEIDTSNIDPRLLGDIAGPNHSQEKGCTEVGNNVSQDGHGVHNTSGKTPLLLRL